MNKGLSNKQLAAYFSCSETTIKRRKQKYKLISNNEYIDSVEFKKKLVNNYSNEELAEYFNCSLFTIIEKRKKFLKQEVILSIQNLHKKDLSIVSIAKTLKIDPATVSSYINTNIKDKYCPYCKEYASDNWKSVRAHTSNCNKATSSYYISLVYGSILLSDLYNKNIAEIRYIYPKITTTELTSISAHLRNLGYSTQILWTKETAKQTVVDWYNEHEKIPTTRETYGTYKLPSKDWATYTFGSWNAFIEYCGYEPNDSGYGTTISYKDGNVLRSNFEFYFVDNFLYGKYDYEYEKPYPGNTSRISDFYLPEFDTYIELAGGLRPEVIKEKIQFCKDNNLKLLVLYPEEVYSKDFTLVL